MALTGQQRSELGYYQQKYGMCSDEYLAKKAELKSQASLAAEVAASNEKAARIAAKSAERQAEIMAAAERDKADAIREQTDVIREAHRFEDEAYMQKAYELGMTHTDFINAFRPFEANYVAEARDIYDQKVKYYKERVKAAELARKKADSLDEQLIEANSNLVKWKAALYKSEADLPEEPSTGGCGAVFEAIKHSFIIAAVVVGFYEIFAHEEPFMRSYGALVLGIITFLITLTHVYGEYADDQKRVDARHMSEYKALKALYCASPELKAKRIEEAQARKIELAAMAAEAGYNAKLLESETGEELKLKITEDFRREALAAFKG